MDRNWQDIDDRETISVALRKESVDRNRIIAKEYDWDALSLSARRAWIEIGFRAAMPVSVHRRSPQGERG